MIACLPDEPRYLGDHDVFALQETVIAHILKAEREVEARAAAPTAVDPIQQTVAEELKDAIRRKTVDRDLAKSGIRFLGQPMGKSLHLKLRAAFAAWDESHDDVALLAEIAALAQQFQKHRPATAQVKHLRREELELICFEYVTG